MHEDANRPVAGKDSSGGLFDSIVRVEGLKNDAALARRLNLAPAQISKIRHGSTSVSPAVILRVHEQLGWPVGQIRYLMRVQS